MLWSALSLSLGYNATLVTLGSSLLGAAAGMAGTFLYLSKKALISDAISHATLPGLGLAFLMARGFGWDERQLAILLTGSAASAALGLYFVTLLTQKTRLTQDTAIGCVLSVFFAFGVVLLTIIQTVPGGRKAGLESFLLGSTAGMLYSDALLILILSLFTTLLLLVFLRPIKLITFDASYGETLGLSSRGVEILVLFVALAVTVLGMKIVGLILIVALLIIPAVSARFWSEKADVILLISAGFGAISGYIGSTISAILFSLLSGRFTIPTLGSIVQKGKFSACMPDDVNALNNVDFPTLGNPTIPHLSPIIFLNVIASKLFPNHQKQQVQKLPKHYA